MLSSRRMTLPALCAVVLVAAPAEAKVLLKGTSHGCTLVVPGNDVVSGMMELAITKAAVKSNKSVPWTVSCKPGKTPTKQLVTLAAMKNGQRTMSREAESIGLDRGDRCTIKRRGKVVHRVTLR